MSMSVQATATGFRITSDFHAIDSAHSTPHSGIDIAMPEGTELHSVADAVVLAVGEGEKLGKYIKLKLEDGTEMIYGHLSEFNVKADEIVKAGEVIGLSGNTGNSTGPHLHFQVIQNGENIDPAEYVGKLTANNSQWHDFITEPFSKLKDGADATAQFFSDMKSEGIWYAVTGEHFKESFVEGLQYTWQLIVSGSDIAILVGMILGLFCVFGSKRAKDYLYWTVAVYLIIKALGLMTL